MELSAEDALRLNVLLANNPQAIRVDESAMVVHVLSENGDGSVNLNPTCRDEQYLKLVRELFSGHVMGSPGGYPIYLKRWTRMGQAREDNLEQMLLLGEPEAIVAVVGAAGLTDELARRAWWAMPDADNARRMLQRESVVQGDMGSVLADFLVEFLPFEVEASDMMTSVRLVLQPGLIDDQARADLWKRGQKKNAFLVGFLQTLPDDLPERAPAHPRFEEWQPGLQQLADQGNAMAGHLLRIFSSAGQTWLRTAGVVFKKPINQDVVNTLMETTADYFAPMNPGLTMEAVMDELQCDAEDCCKGQDAATPNSEVCELLALDKDLCEPVRAGMVLARLGYPVVRPIFSRSTAIGSLMRRKLEPVTKPVFECLAVLQGKS